MTFRSALFSVALVAGAATASPGEVVRVEHHDPSTLPSRGPANALVTIELFFIPGSGSRTPVYPLIEKLQADHPNRIRLVYRILEGNGQARFHFAALEAHAEGRFLEFMAELNAQLAAHRSQLTTAELIELGRRIGMDPQRLAKAISNPPAAYEDLIKDNARRRDRRLANATTPAVLFNGRAGRPTSTQSAKELERAYQAALELARDAIDRGADPRNLLDAIDHDAPPDGSDIAIQAGDVDDDFDALPAEPPLASPPLALAGMPSYGPAGAAVTITVLCSPTSPNCRAPLQTARTTADLYPQTVRVVWAPYFSVERDEAADLSLLGDAALCAEKVGTRPETDAPLDPMASPGWLWLDAVRDEANARRRRLSVDQLIDKVAGKLLPSKGERLAFAQCRAQLAGATVGFVEAARHAGVRTTPTTIVGGRIYPPIKDAKTLQALVEAEVAPGLLGDMAPAGRAVR